MSLALRVEWDRLSKLISGFLETRQFYLNGSDKSSFINGRRQLDKTWKVIVNGLDTFLKRHKMVLPEEATQSLGVFLGDASGSLLPDPWELYPMGDRFLALASIRSALDFHLADFSLFARRLSERAFSHLRRSIVVDEEVRLKWQRAYRSRGEPHAKVLAPFTS